jgi:putative membrane protein
MRIVTATLVTLAMALGNAVAADAPLTDPQIAAIVVTANPVDIDAGQLARDKASSKEVRDFANQMVTDHTSVNRQASDLVKKLGVKPEDNATAQGLRKGGTDNIAKLKTLEGQAFDRAYIDQEVAYHQAVLDALDTMLIPNAKNEELKGLMVKVRPAFVAHLEHARHLQSTLGR